VRVCVCVRRCAVLCCFVPERRGLTKVQQQTPGTSEQWFGKVCENRCLNAEKELPAECSSSSSNINATFDRAGRLRCAKRK
uniref:Uncharacterized protein n=1 Tax=Anopheles quadriannulatus TaxID=34691 RepID=A0A182XSJ1_ANOQN